MAGPRSRLPKGKGAGGTQARANPKPYPEKSPTNAESLKTSQRPRPLPLRPTSQLRSSATSPSVLGRFFEPSIRQAETATMAATQGAISKRRKFVADGVFYAELNEFFQRELAEEGYSGVEVRVTPTVTDISMSPYVLFCAQCLVK